MSAERRSRYLRVVRPGSGAGSDAAATPPLPVEPPLTPPLWLDHPQGRPGFPDPRLDGALPFPHGRTDLPPPAAPHGAGFGSAGFGSTGATALRAPLPDEDPVGAALRASLHQAVDGVRPATDSLARLRVAVPQRRTLRRRAYGGAAVAASLALLGLTALHSLGPDADTNAQAGPAGPFLPGAHASASGTGSGGPGANSFTPGLPPTGGSGWPTQSGHPGGAVLVPLPSGGVTTVAASLTHSYTPTGPLSECSRTQLGNGAAGLAPADASGIVYGSFAISNVSGTACKISSAGAIHVLAAIGTTPIRFTVTPHTATDPAVALPAPDPAHPAVALAPGQTYVVDFAYVPDACQSSTGTDPSDSASASPASAADSSVGSATGSAGSTTAGSTGGTSGAATDGTAGNGVDSPSTSPGTPGGTGGASGTTGTGNPSTTTGPSVQLAAVPASGGAAAASTTLQGACAGTIYRTDPLAAPR